MTEKEKKRRRQWRRRPATQIGCVRLSASDVTKTFLAADLNKRVREMATRRSCAATRPLSTASMTSSANADKSDDEIN
jgi:hypothetical protein